MVWFHTEIHASGSVTKKLFTSPSIWHVDKGNKYDVIGNYNLVIKDAEASSDGGRYQCETDENDLVDADLVVLGNVYVCETLCTLINRNLIV